MENNPEDYAELVAALPASHEIDLMNSEALSTAFYACRRKGWSVEQLIGDAIHTVGRQGVGGVITRFRGLSQHTPVNRTRPSVERYRPDPPAEKVPDEWIDERMALLHRIGAERIGEDEAGTLMRDLIAEQRARGGTDG